MAHTASSGLREWQRLFEQQDWSVAAPAQADGLVRAINQIVASASHRHDAETLRTALNLLREAHWRLLQLGLECLSKRLNDAAETARFQLDIVRTYL